MPVLLRPTSDSPDIVSAGAGNNGPSTPRLECHGFGDRGDGDVGLRRETVERLLAAGEFFWIDLYRPGAADFEILRDLFRFHPLAVQDSEHFDQRPKIDDYGDFVFFVVYGASHDSNQLIEVHCFYSGRFLVTVHRGSCPVLVELRRRCEHDREPAMKPSRLLYEVVDGLAGTFFPSLSALDDRIDDLEDQVFATASDNQLQEMFQMKRQLVAFRKAVTPQRDAFGSLGGRLSELPGFDREDEHYFRDVYDHLIRISDLIDSYRDLLTGAMDVYLSTVSNRLNAVMKQLTIIATVFLPLTFITGFFGQNIGWLTRHVQGSAAFVFLGLGLEVFAVLVLFALFKRLDWF